MHFLPRSPNRSAGWIPRVLSSAGAPSRHVSKYPFLSTLFLAHPRQLLGPFSSFLPPLLPPPPACCGSFPLLSLSGLFREHFSLSVCLFACLLAWLAHLFSFEKNRPGQDCWAVHGSHSPTGLLSGCMCSTVNWFIFLAYFFFPLLPTF